ncbi:MAG: hypothetical protein BYD32DRAFT_422582 [Podila humilis]|nr:MAG: hypothetical protein BYD32DRAFT_422582 [Podila humilis]
MSSSRGLAHSVPALKNGAKNCSRCGKDFYIFWQKKNCRNCGCMVCESCSSYRTRLPQFGYADEVRCCTYCAHFLHVYKMDYAGLSKLNIKTLRGYLLSYNVSTQGMIEKQDLIKAIQSLKPIPEASEVYFRGHLPETPEKSMSLFDEIANFRRPSTTSDSTSGSGSGSGSGQGTNSSSDSSDGWSWDLDKFFSKLFGDDTPATHSNRPSPRSQPQTQNRPSQPSPGQPYSNGRPSAGPGTPGTSFRPTAPQTGYPYRPAAGHPPTMNTQQRPSTYRPPSSTQSSSRPAHPYPPASQSSAPQTPRPGQYAQPTTSAASSAGPRTASQPSSGGTSSGSRRTTTTTTTTTSSTTTTMTLDQVMVSKADPSTLPIKAIKAILDSSFVTYVGVVEKRDLVDRLQKLIDNTRAEQAMVQEQEVEAKKSPATSSAAISEDDNLCKICCDAALNCVMLNCNHMATCMDCGKLIMEGSRMCPICREYVVKLLHVFRA